MQYTKADKYTHAVLAVAGELAGIAKGSTEATEMQSTLGRRAWLVWRVTEGWDTPQQGHVAYDGLVRELAKEAICLFDRWLVKIDALRAEAPGERIPRRKGSRMGPSRALH